MLAYALAIFHLGDNAVWAAMAGAFFANNFRRIDYNNIK
jgi:hypothetical protein